MQFIGMDCSGRSNNAGRDSELGDDMSHEDHSDDENRECDSMEGDHITGRSLVGRLNASGRSSGGEMSYVGGGGGDAGSAAVRSPDRQMGHHHHQFPPNHPLNALGNFMGMSGLHGITSLQHNDVLEKLKIQVRDMKVGLMEQDYAHAATFGANVLSTPINTAFTLPPTSMASFGHAASSTASGVNSVANGGNTNAQNSTNSIAASTATLTNGCGGGGGKSSFSFTSPTAPNTTDVNPASNSSTSSEASSSSQQNNGWSFEEQYKQVRQLYEINDDPKRKEWLDDLFSFMQKRGSPINRLPIMAKSVLDLFELYNLVIARGGLVDVINKKLWQEIIKGLHLPSSITSAAFTLRTQYMKYLYAYECEKKNLSSPNELQSAIDGNRREGRRSSYGQYEAMHTQMQLQMPRPSMQMTPLALVTHAAAAGSQQQAQAAAVAAAHHRLMAPAFVAPNLMSKELEHRMMEYLKLMQSQSEEQQQQQQQQLQQQQQQLQQQLQQHQQHQQQIAINGLALAQKHPQYKRSPSPEANNIEALHVLEKSRAALWSIYNNNASPPVTVKMSPQGNGVMDVTGVPNGVVEPQRSEALNLSDLPLNKNSIKRERQCGASGDRNNNHSHDHNGDGGNDDDLHHLEPPIKRPVGVDNSLMARFYLPHAAAVAAANFHHATHNAAVASAAASAISPAGSDGEDNEHEDDDNDEHNTTASSSHIEIEHHREQYHPLLNGGHDGHIGHVGGVDGLHLRNHSSASAHNDKSDDSAIENSPSTSASVHNGHHHLRTSPVSTKKIHLSNEAVAAAAASLAPLDALRLLSGLKFNVAHSGTNANGESELMVNLELNGVKYSGVLKANAAASAASVSASAAVLNNNNNNNISVDGVDDVDDAKVHDEMIGDAKACRDEVAETEAKPTLVANGGSSSAAVLQDAMITS